MITYESAIELLNVAGWTSIKQLLNVYRKWVIWFKNNLEFFKFDLLFLMYGILSDIITMLEQCHAWIYKNGHLFFYLINVMS